MITKGYIKDTLLKTYAISLHISSKGSILKSLAHLPYSVFTVHFFYCYLPYLFKGQKNYSTNHDKRDRFIFRMPSGRSRRPSVISDDEFSETAQTIIKRHKKATVEEIYENLDFCDMSRDEVYMRLESMCEAGILEKMKQKNGEVFFKSASQEPPKPKKKPPRAKKGFGF